MLEKEFWENFQWAVDTYRLTQLEADWKLHKVEAPQLTWPMSDFLPIAKQGSIFCPMWWLQ